MQVRVARRVGPLGGGGGGVTQWAQGGGVNAFAVNVHGVETVVTGDYTVEAYTPVEEEWFCDGWGAYVGL